MEVAGSILDEVSYFLVKIGLRGGVAVSIPDELRKKVIFWDSTACTDRLCALSFQQIFCAANIFRLCELFLTLFPLQRSDFRKIFGIAADRTHIPNLLRKQGSIPEELSSIELIRKKILFWVQLAFYEIF